MSSSKTNKKILSHLIKKKAENKQTKKQKKQQIQQ